MAKLRCCDAAVLVLRRTGNPAIICGDAGLLHLVAAEMGWEHQSRKTEWRVLNALSRTPGELLSYFVKRADNCTVRMFQLPECDD